MSERAFGLGSSEKSTSYAPNNGIKDGLNYPLAVMAGLGGLASRAVRRRLGPGAASWLALVGAALVANAFATGAVANVYDRLQARVAWLLPFTVLVLATELLLGLRADWRAQPRAAVADQIG